MKVVVAIASHERTKPLGIVLRCLPKDWHVALVISPTDILPGEAMEDRVHVWEHPNSPLGAKWQFAVDMARTLEPDLLIITGSDDVLQVDTKALEKTMAGCDMLGLRWFLAYDGKKHYRCEYRRHVPMPIGGGRVYTRSLLDRMRWKLFDTHKEKHLDERGWWNARRAGAVVKNGDETSGLQVVALKGPWPCKNPLQKYITGPNITVTPVTQTKAVAYQF